MNLRQFYTGKAIGTLIVLAAVAAYFVVMRPEPSANAPETPQAGTYSSEEYGLSFAYPDSYQLTEHDAEGGAPDGHHAIILMPRSALPLPEAGEGPPSIIIDIYRNNRNSLSTEAWIRNSPRSNFALSGEQTLTSVTLDGKPALSYRWSGLYDGTTIAIARPEWVYAFTVTYREPGADIVQDFVALRESVRIR